MKLKGLIRDEEQPLFNIEPLGNLYVIHIFKQDKYPEIFIGYSELLNKFILMCVDDYEINSYVDYTICDIYIDDMYSILNKDLYADDIMAKNSDTIATLFLIIEIDNEFDYDYEKQNYRDIYETLNDIKLELPLEKFQQIFNFNYRSDIDE